MVQKFKEFEIWRRGKIYYSKIYGLTSKFANSEKSELSNPIRRVSVFMPSNIVEESSRKSNNDFIRFLQIAADSAYKIEAQLLITSDFKLNNHTINNSI